MRGFVEYLKFDIRSCQCIAHRRRRLMVDIKIVCSGERHRTSVRMMEDMLAGDPELDKDINPYNLPEVRFNNECISEV